MTAEYMTYVLVLAPSRTMTTIKHERLPKRLAIRENNTPRNDLKTSYDLKSLR